MCIRDRQYVDETIHDISYQNGELQVLTDQNAYYYSESGKEKAVISFQEEPLRMFCSKGEKISALVLGDYREFKSVKLSLLGASGEAEGAVSLQFSVDDIDAVSYTHLGGWEPSAMCCMQNLMG